MGQAQARRQRRLPIRLGPVLQVRGLGSRLQKRLGCARREGALAAVRAAADEGNGDGRGLLALPMRIAC